jgi:hypothetical protein
MDKNVIINQTIKYIYQFIKENKMKILKDYCKYKSINNHLLI